MADCCDDKACALDTLRERQSGTLRVVLGINAFMFVVEGAAGLLASSTALLSDSLDNFGDAVTYALSLYAVSQGPRVKARVALVKGGLILVAALAVIAQVAWRLVHPAMPMFEAMSGVAFVALAANGTCLALLRKHRQEDVNMSSVYECSRNDIASNLTVLAAAGGVWLAGAGWPDLVVGIALAILLSRSAIRVIGRARREIAAPAAPTPAARKVTIVRR
ncbi:MAG: cation transporter [Betaproteobacteria bacterium]